MKKILKFVAIVLLIVAMVQACEAVNRYEIKAVCSQVHDGIATFTDCEGHYWDWIMEDEEHFEVNDVVMLTLNNLETNMREDDIIVKIDAFN